MIQEWTNRSLEPAPPSQVTAPRDSSIQDVLLTARKERISTLCAQWTGPGSPIPPAMATSGRPEMAVTAAQDQLETPEIELLRPS